MSSVTLSDVHDQLNIPASDTTHDAELQRYLDAADGYIAYRIGPLTPTQFTGEVHDGGWPTIALFNVPVISIQSVTEYLGETAYPLTSQPPGSTVDNYGYSLDDPASGILVRRSGAGTAIRFLAGPRSVVVDYTAGWQTVPPEVQLAVLLDIQGLYQLTQQGGRPQFSGDGAEYEQWAGSPMHPFPRLGALLDGPSRTPSIA